MIWHSLTKYKANKCKAGITVWCLYLKHYLICSFVFRTLYRLPYRLLYKLKFMCTFLVTLWTSWTVQRIQTSGDIMAHIKYLLAPYIINPAAAYFITILTPRRLDYYEGVVSSCTYTVWQLLVWWFRQYIKPASRLTISVKPLRQSAKTHHHHGEDRKRLRQTFNQL